MTDDKDSQSECLQTFENIEDFKEFYKNNKAELDAKSTVVLNKLYKIKDYIIRKNYGSIGFKRIGSCVRMNPLNKRITVVEETLNELIEIVNNLQSRFKY